MIEARSTEEVTTGGRLGELYAAHAPDAVRLAYLLTGDRHLAEDLVHEAFVRLFGRFRDLRNPDAFGAYPDGYAGTLGRRTFRNAYVFRT